MPRTKRELTSEITKEMKSYAKDFKVFRTDNKLSQRFLSEIINISRRTIQNIESGKIIPQEATLKAFTDLKEKYEAEGKTGRRKRKKTKDEGEF
jgi:DNA-binding transcriptional regulator YiaG